jgi:hypothetical protein
MPLLGATYSAHSWLWCGEECEMGGNVNSRIMMRRLGIGAVVEI